MENITFEGAWSPYPGHFKEPGFNFLNVLNRCVTVCTILVGNELHLMHTPKSQERWKSCHRRISFGLSKEGPFHLWVAPCWAALR